MTKHAPLKMNGTHKLAIAQSPPSNTISPHLITTIINANSLILKVGFNLIKLYTMCITLHLLTSKFGKAEWRRMRQASY